MSHVTERPLPAQAELDGLRRLFEDELNRRISGLGLEATVETIGRAGIGLYAVVSEKATGRPLPPYLRQNVLDEATKITSGDGYGGVPTYVLAKGRQLH